MKVKPTNTLHIVFGEAAGGVLRQALRAAGRSDRVITYWDDLSFGPIDPPDAASRSAWATRELGFPAARPSLARRERAFWTVALATTAAHRIVWVSRRTPHDYSNFSEFLWRLGEQACEIVDLTDVVVTWHERDGGARQEPVVSLALLNPDQVREYALWDRAAPLAPAERARHREAWRTLRGENADFRIVKDGALVSTPIDFFDQLLLSCVVDRWRKSARVVGEALTKLFETPGLQTGDAVLFGRLRKLAALGQVETKGDMARMLWSEVRLPAPGPRSNVF